jgi:hypothetical protein
MKVQYALVTAIGAIGLLAATPGLAKTVHFTTALNGASEVPPNDSTGTGEVDADFDTASNAFSYTITYSGLTGPAVAAHFHGPSAPGVNAPPIIMIDKLPSPIKGSAKLTPHQAKELMSGQWYFNVHPAAHGGGEIRGQLTPP